jgi:UDP-N-acetylglucosamine 2-epimerase (non-hydrolysing)
LQEETTYLGKPCLTARENTERPITVQIGTNEMVGTDTALMIKYSDQILNNNWKKGEIPKYWDGRTAERITEIIAKMLLR